MRYNWVLLHRVEPARGQSRLAHETGIRNAGLIPVDQIPSWEIDRVSRSESVTE
jgi:hypothetical protein